jgi:hypothetical protein
MGSFETNLVGRRCPPDDHAPLDGLLIPRFEGYPADSPTLLPVVTY